MSEWHLAQVNVARLRAPIDDPAIAEFVEALEPVNRLAEESPGFVWRFQTEDGNATAVRPYDDALVIINISVWESLDHLADFVYRSGHVAYLRRKGTWFGRMAEADLAMWWMPAGTRSSIGDAVDRLNTLRRVGPSPRAFTFREPYPSAGDATPRSISATTVRPDWMSQRAWARNESSLGQETNALRRAGLGSSDRSLDG